MREIEGMRQDTDSSLSPMTVGSESRKLKHAPRLWILAPIFRDWNSIPIFLDEIAEGLSASFDVSVMLVDDGTPENEIEIVEDVRPGISHMEIIFLKTNVGHQRAIAVGLSILKDYQDFDYVCIMDSDGEDDPRSALELVRRASESPVRIVVAKRGKRKEGPRFRLGYAMYRIMIRSLTGHVLDYGNLCVIPKASVNSIASSEFVGIHLAATIEKSKVGVTRVTVDRRCRYGGISKMNFAALVQHGLGALACFFDRFFLRFVSLLLALLLFLGILASSIVGVRFSSDAAVPGWATTSLGFVAVVTLQALGVTLIAALIMASQRRSSQDPTGERVKEWVSRRVTVSPTLK